MPYILHGPFGFGYDTGIYKKIFEGITTFAGILKSEIYLLPAFLAYVFNSLGLPLDWLLYYVHIFFSVAIAVPLYLLTKHYFGKAAGVLAIVIFTISYAQLFASEFYLYKAEMGAFFMLFAFYFYARRSLWFYLFAFLLAITQLPQFLILTAGVSIASVFGLRKELKYHGLVSLVLILSVLFLLIVSPQHILSAVEVVSGALRGDPSFDAHFTGLFISVGEYLGKEWWMVLLCVAGLCLSYKKKNILALYVSLLFLFVVVFGRLFFEKRFVMEMDLLMIPFVSYMPIVVFDRFFKFNFMKILAVLVVLSTVGVFTYYYFVTTHAAISRFEVWALDYINKNEDINYVLVTDSVYAPWMYGFSDKITLAPGIFESVWSYDQFMKYHGGSVEDKIAMLFDISKKYGAYLLFEGIRDSHFKFNEKTSYIEKVFDVGDTVVYEVFPEPLEVERL